MVWPRDTPAWARRLHSTESLFFVAAKAKKIYPIDLTALPEGARMRLIAPDLFSTCLEDGDGMRHGYEQFWVANSPGKLVPHEKHVQWEHGACVAPEGTKTESSHSSGVWLQCMNTTGIALPSFDKTYQEQKQSGKSVSVQLCETNVGSNRVKLVHFNKDAQGRLVKNGPELVYCVWPDREPFLVHSVYWRQGFRDGYEIFWAQSMRTNMPYESCRRHWSAGQLEGLELLQDDIGNRAERFYRKSILHGPEESYYANGKMHVRCNWTVGVRSGEQILYYKNGECCEIGAFHDGHRDGVWIRLERSGKLLQKVVYVDNQLQGVQLRRDKETGRMQAFQVTQELLRAQRLKCMQDNMKRLQANLATADAADQDVSRLQRKLHNLEQTIKQN